MTAPKCGGLLILKFLSHDLLATQIFLNASITFLVSFLTLWGSSMPAIFQKVSYGHSEQFHLLISNSGGGNLKFLKSKIE